MTPHRNQTTDDEEIGSYPYTDDETDEKTQEEIELDEVGMSIVGEGPEDLIDDEDSGDALGTPKKKTALRHADPSAIPEDEDF
jgi:hypothetical protein